jgi:hypothetical protein
VLMLLDTRAPRMRARMNNTMWKGKVFGDSGNVINQWACFRALTSQANYDTSWYDGRPCIVMQYAPGTPLFANNRDELRQIGPGLYLARLYLRNPYPKFRGYFVLQFE